MLNVQKYNKRLQQNYRRMVQHFVSNFKMNKQNENNMNTSFIYIIRKWYKSLMIIIEIGSFAFYQINLKNKRIYFLFNSTCFLFLNCVAKTK